MRKIILKRAIDPNSFKSIVELLEKHDDGSVKSLHRKEFKPVKEKYTKEEKEQIQICNSILKEENLPELTEEEIDYMLDPYGLKKRSKNLDKQMDDLENLQRLAGFKVEKKIISL